MRPQLRDLAEDLGEVGDQCNLASGGPVSRRAGDGHDAGAGAGVCPFPIHWRSARAGYLKIGLRVATFAQMHIKKLGLYKRPSTTVRVLSPREFLALSERERLGIAHVKVVFPKLGSGSFGAFRVVYRSSANGMNALA